MIRNHPKKRLYLWIGIFSLCLILFGVQWWYFFGMRLGFPRSESDYYMPDPVLGHRHRPYARREFAWPEHPRGRIVMQANNLGMRRDQDTDPQKRDGTVRILVVGDSNLDGVVYNSESFATCLETMMNSEPGARRRFEILNAATGHYGPDNYRAALEAYDILGIEAAIVGFYTGNDFLDAARNVETGLPNRVERPSGYMAKLKRANRAHAGTVAQLLNQAYYFTTFPEMREPVLARVETLFREMYRRALQKNMALFVILIPTKADVEPENLDSDWEKAIAELQLGKETFRIAAQMRIELGGRLRRAGIPCLDAAVLMDTNTSALFWNQDYHLNVAGHQSLARIFYREFGSQLAAIP